MCWWYKVVTRLFLCTASNLSRKYAASEASVIICIDAVAGPYVDKSNSAFSGIIKAVDGRPLVTE